MIGTTQAIQLHPKRSPEYGVHCGFHEQALLTFTDHKQFTAETNTIDLGTYLNLKLLVGVGIGSNNMSKLGCVTSENSTTEIFDGFGGEPKASKLALVTPLITIHYKDTISKQILQICVVIPSLNQN